MTNPKTQFVINQEKADEHRESFLLIFKKTVLRIRDEARNNPIYLIRYSLFSCAWFSIKIHRIMLSDDDCAHDHPWSFISLILKGGYWEHTPFPYPLQFWYGPGSLLWRRAPSPHRLELPEGKTALTLVITFKRSREWGFCTSRGWILWRDYIRSGSKC